MIDLRINKEGLAKNIARAKENNIIIPTIAQMQHPETIPEKVQAKLDQPIPLGYSSAGVVEEAGRDSGGLKAGDRVALMINGNREQWEQAQGKR